MCVHLCLEGRKLNLNIKIINLQHLLHSFLPLPQNTMHLDLIIFWDANFCLQIINLDKGVCQLAPGGIHHSDTYSGIFFKTWLYLQKANGMGETKKQRWKDYEYTIHENSRIFLKLWFLKIKSIIFRFPGKLEYDLDISHCQWIMAKFVTW